MTFGKSGRIQSYIVPANVEAARELLALLQAEEEVAAQSRTARERFAAARRPMGGRPAEVLRETREAETY
ncbi:hypothetical protein AUL38_07365 [Leucobacter sp. G161]|nr:hypothetical protein AUL38_07365 [Leucobacter sp. G161]